MKKLLIIILVTPLFLKAQYTRKDSLEYTYFAIKTSPLSLLDPIISSASIGLEYRHKQKYAIEAMYHFLIPQLLPHVQGKENENLTKFLVGARRYFNDEFYVSLEYRYIKYQYDFTEDYFTSKEDISVYYFDLATVKKRINIANVMVGVEMIGKKNPRFIYDVHVGVGMRYVDIDFTNLVGSYMVHPRDFPTADGAEELSRNASYDIAETNELRGNFLIGFRFGYKLWSKF
jgi:hypothetical protein